MAGGIVLASILAHLVGIKAAVTIMTVALILSHLSRAMMYAKETDWSITGRVLIFGCPTIVIGAIIFGKISPTTIAIVFTAVLISSFPIKYRARRHEISTGPRLLAGASMVWGMLAGNVIGPGFCLAPFLLGTGMSRLTFVGTTATVTLVMNVLKLSVFVEANSLEELTSKLRDVDVSQALRTLDEFNRAVDNSVEFDPTSLDGKCTSGLNIDKTNWANQLNTPPFRAYPVTCGITFTYLGLRIDMYAAVLDESGTQIPGLFACGEMVGGLFYDGYPGGTGLTSGAVFGRLAGHSAELARATSTSC